MQEEGWRVGTSSGVIGASHETALLASRVYAIVKKRMSRSPDCWDGRLLDDILQSTTGCP